MPSKAKPSDLGTGMAAQAAKKVASRKRSAADALAMARRFTAQSTDSNNKEKAIKPTRR